LGRWAREIHLTNHLIKKFYSSLGLNLPFKPTDLALANLKPIICAKEIIDP